jgi:hypothetical protein
MQGPLADLLQASSAKLPGLFRFEVICEQILLFLGTANPLGILNGQQICR